MYDSLKCQYEADYDLEGESDHFSFRLINQARQQPIHAPSILAQQALVRSQA